MPKEVDHRARRTLIAEALMRVAAERGLEAVSLRHVAAEAGVSAGMVQHYFRTKHEMMLFALGVVGESVEARLCALDLGARPPARALVRALLAELLPLDERRRTESRVMLAFLAYAAGRPEIAAVVGEGTRVLHEHLTEQIRAVRAAGGGVDVDPVHAARALMALVDGLGLLVVSRHCTADEALATLDTQLDVLLGPGE